MAVKFIHNISETDLLNAYNNNIVTYKSTTNQMPLKSTIEAGGYSFEITPNSNGEFRYNFKELVKALINQNNFKDNIEPNLENSLVYLDNSLFLDLPVTYKIAFTNIAEEELTKQYKFKKSVQQIVRKNISTVNNEIELLIPNKDQTAYLTYFEGYPFDFSIYSNANRTITIVNKRTQNSITTTLSEGVNRLFVSDGRSNFSLSDELPLYIGLNELEFKINGNVVKTLFLNKVDSKCGVLLKWFNQSGAYSYWLFSHIHTTKRKTKTIGKVSNDFKNLQDATSRSNIIGKNATDILKLSAGYLNSKEIDIVSEILASPKVAFYTNKRYQQTDINSWVDVEVKGSNQNIRTTRYTHNEYNIKIELPLIYTQTL